MFTQCCTERVLIMFKSNLEYKLHAPSEAIQDFLQTSASSSYKEKMETWTNQETFKYISIKL